MAGPTVPAPLEQFRARGVANPGAGNLPDIKPHTPVASLQRSRYGAWTRRYPANLVLPAVGMSAAFAERVTGRRGWFTVNDVLDLLDQDCFQETSGYRHRALVEGSTVIDPDAEVQAAVRDLFASFRSSRSAYQVVAAFKGRRFPLRAGAGAWQVVRGLCHRLI